MKRYLISTICFVALALAGTFFYFKGRRYEVVITQTQIDEALQKRFPVEKSYLLIFGVTYSNPKVKLLPDANRIEIGLDTELNGKILGESKRLGSSILITTAIDYRNETQQFFLSEPQITNFALQGIPQEQLAKVTKFVSETVRANIQLYPVYTLRAKNAKMAAAKLLLKNVEVRNTEIHVTLGL